MARREGVTGAESFARSLERAQKAHLEHVEGLPDEDTDPACCGAGDARAELLAPPATEVLGRRRLPPDHSCGAGLGR